MNEIARNVQVAVANALARPADAPAASTTIVIADRNPVPPALARLAGDAEAARGGSPNPSRCRRDVRT